jgi:hypothetical protein
MPLKLCIFVIVMLAGFELPSKAHDIYSHLRDSWGNSCCDNKDCRPARYQVTPTGVQMFVDGDWVEVPNYTIQYRALIGDTGATGGGHWCGRAYQNVDNSVFHVTQCAVLPPNATVLLRIPFAFSESGIGYVP